MSRFVPSRQQIFLGSSSGGLQTDNRWKRSATTQGGAVVPATSAQNMEGAVQTMKGRNVGNRSDEGFTLIELLIVIVILAILAAIVVFAVGTTTTNAKVSACNSDAKSVETAVEAYKAQIGSYPSAGVAGETQLTTASGTPPVGPWLRQWPSATLAANGYLIGLSANGVVTVQNNTTAAAPYDTSNNCTGIT